MRVHSLGHVVLKVRNLERSVPFYRDVLGLKQVGQHGEKMVFFSIVDNHHDLALLETDNSAISPSEESPGLHHVAFKVGDSLQELQEAKDWLVKKGVEPDRARDHMATQSLYFLTRMVIKLSYSWKEIQKYGVKIAAPLLIPTLLN